MKFEIKDTFEVQRLILEQVRRLPNGHLVDKLEISSLLVCESIPESAAAFGRPLLDNADDLIECVHDMIADAHLLFEGRRADRQ